MTERIPRQFRKLRPGPGQSSAVVGADQRQRLNTAMVDQVSDRGFDAVTIRSLVGLAGVSTRAFYAHFQSKEHCFVDTYQLIIKNLMRAIEQAQSGERRREERLRIAFRTIVWQAATYPSHARFVLVESPGMGETAVLLHRRMVGGLQSVLSSALYATPRRGWMPAPVFAALVEGAAAVLTDRLDSNGLAEAEALGDALCDWALSYRIRPGRASTSYDRNAVPVPRNVPTQKQSHEKQREAAQTVARMYWAVTLICRELAQDRRRSPVGFGRKVRQTSPSASLTATVAQRIRSAAQQTLESATLRTEATAMAAAALLLDEMASAGPATASSVVPLVTFVASVPAVESSIALSAATAMATKPRAASLT